MRLTQKQVSEMVGVTTDHICRIERGKMVPKTKTLVALCRVLKTEPNKIITGWQ
jgi:DNA-binding XRE family transcriptional regulator